jgi:hypothetical protein
MSAGPSCPTAVARCGEPGSPPRPLLAAIPTLAFDAAAAEAYAAIVANGESSGRARANRTFHRHPLWRA